MFRVWLIKAMFRWLCLSLTMLPVKPTSISPYNFPYGQPYHLSFCLLIKKSLLEPCNFLFTMNCLRLLGFPSNFLLWRIFPFYHIFWWLSSSNFLRKYIKAVFLPPSNVAIYLFKFHFYLFNFRRRVQYLFKDFENLTVS